MLKKCSNCFKLKPVSEFYLKKRVDRFQSRCKACNTEVVRGYRERARERNKEAATFKWVAYDRPDYGN